MTQTRSIRAGVLAFVLVVSAAAGTAGAVEPKGATPHPHTPGTETTYNVGVTFESGDSVVDAGDGADTLANVTLAFGVDEEFDGSLANASVENTTVWIAGERVPVGNVTVDGGTAVTVEFATPANVSAGDRMYVHVRNATTPTLPSYAKDRSTDLRKKWKNRMRFHVDVSATDPDGNVDGPTRVGYSVVEAFAWLETPVVSPAETTRTIHVRGTLPNRGYVVARELTASGPGDVVGVSDAVGHSHFPQSIPVHLDEPLTDDTRLHLSLYRETSGNDSFDLDADEPYRNDGVDAARSVSVVVPDADATAAAGTVWTGQTLLYEGRPNVPYAVHRVTDDGDVGASVTTVTATGDGVVLVNTSDLAVGERYVLASRIGSGVVDLDGDGDERVSDDAMTVATQSVAASVEGGTLVVDSERGTYTALVRADGADEATLRAAFGGAVTAAAGDGEGVPVRVPADGRVAVDTAAFAPGEYSLTVTAPDTGATATTTLTVAERTATATATPADTATDETTAATTSESADADGETGVTAPLGPLVPLVALAAAVGLLARRDR